MVGASLIFDGYDPVEKFTILPFSLKGDLFDTPENRVITSGWLSLASNRPFGSSKQAEIERIKAPTGYRCRHKPRKFALIPR
jgi:hypothetical protein